MRRALSKSWFTYLLAATALALLLSGCSLDLTRQSELEEEISALSDELTPNPDLSPEEVVKTQVEALQHNNSDDKGIEVTFRFASPANKHITGPLGRFRKLIKSSAYSPMLNHKMAEYDPVEKSGDTVTQRVTIIGNNGAATIYLFQLSKQSDPPCKDCWMTDSVIAVPSKKQNLQGA